MEERGSGTSGPDAPTEAGSLGSVVDPAAAGSMSEGRGGIVTARGTGEGLIIRLDGRVAHDALREALQEFITERKNFLGGQEVSLEWVGEIPEYNLLKKLTEDLNKDFKIVVKTSELYERPKGKGLSGKVEHIDTARTARNTKSEEKELSLFDGIESIGMEDDSLAVDAVSEGARGLEDAALWDDPDARIIVATLRSGQKIETEHSLIICGDVNSGAEVTAGGDIIVLGTLRGVAHAGAYDETGGGRFIFALDLQPTQLRIGMVITRGSTGGRAAGGAEIARVDGDTISVEPYHAKQVVQSRTGRI